MVVEVHALEVDEVAVLAQVGEHAARVLAGGLDAGSDLLDLDRLVVDGHELVDVQPVEDRRRAVEERLAEVVQ
eukprot:15435357-Alexandrium_andersonii.AAC.1